MLAGIGTLRAARNRIWRRLRTGWKSGEWRWVGKGWREGEFAAMGKSELFPAPCTSRNPNPSTTASFRQPLRTSLRCDEEKSSFAFRVSFLGPNSFKVLGKHVDCCHASRRSVNPRYALEPGGCDRNCRRKNSLSRGRSRCATRSRWVLYAAVTHSVRRRLNFQPQHARARAQRRRNHSHW